MDHVFSSIRERWKILAVCLFLASAVWFVFGQTLHFQFIDLDDNADVYVNPVVIQGLTWNGLHHAFTETEVGNWIPLTVLSHMLDCQFYGLWAGGHHLSNVLLHGAAVVLLFFVLRKMTGALWRSAFVAAVFAIHPLRAESVAWIAERKDVLSAFFFMLTLGAYLHYASRPNTMRYLGVAFLLTLGLMSKPMLVTVPCVLLLLDYWPLQRWKTKSRSRLILEKLPLLGLSVAAALAALVANHSAIAPIAKLGLPSRLANAAVATTNYLLQMVWPTGLAAFYPHPRDGLSLGQTTLSAAVIGLISLGVFLFRKRLPYTVTGWLWYLGMLVPVSGIVQAGMLASADRYTYLPQIGIYILITWAVVDLWKNSCVLRVVGGVAVVALALLARTQVAYWRNSETLWRHTLACTGPSPLALRCLALDLSYQGRTNEAISEYEKANAIVNDDPVSDVNLALLYHGKGEIYKAIASYRHALELRPVYLDALNGLALCLSEVGRVDEADATYRRALEMNPKHPGINLNFGLLLVRRGETQLALAHYEKALESNPAFTPGLNNLAWLLATCPEDSIRNGPRAVELAEKARRLTEDKDPGTLDTLAAAYAEAGRFPDALKTAQHAVELSTAQGNMKLAEALTHELVLYQMGKPFRENPQPVE